MGQHHIQLFIFRKGLAARLGHDLRLRVEAPEVTLADGRVRCVIAADSLRVDGAMKAGVLDARAIDASDREAIIETMQEQVLHVALHPSIVYEGTPRVDGDRVDVEGQLTLHGRTVALSLSLSRRNDRLTGEVTLTPSRWGIAPFKALGGTLRVDDRIVVHVDVALDAGASWPPIALG